MRVEKVGVAHEVPPSSSSAQQTDTIGLQVDRLRTVREVTKTHGRESDSTLEDVSKLGNSSREVLNIADTAADGVAVSLASPIVVPKSQRSGINPEGKHVHQVAVMTYTPVTEDFESISRSQVRITTAKFLQRERQLSEMKIEPQARRKADETRVPTVAQCDPDDEMIEQLLRELEELDKPHEWSEDDEALIDALLQDLELKKCNPVANDRSEPNAEVKGTETIKNNWGAFDVLTGSVSEDEAARKSGTGFTAEGTCGSKGSHLTGSRGQPNRLVPIVVIQQRPTRTHGRRFWVPHRKHCRRKTGLQQMRLQRPIATTHRKYGRWKANQKTVQPPRLQRRSDGARRWYSQRERARRKSDNRNGAQKCPPVDVVMHVKHQPSNTRVSTLTKLIF